MISYYVSRSELSVKIMYTLSITKIIKCEIYFSNIKFLSDVYLVDMCLEKGIEKART
jgi:hypothetical protein